MTILPWAIFAMAAAVAANVEPKAAVDEAFAKVRKGDLSSTGDLVKIGPAAVPHVAHYLTDANPKVRTEAVALLGAIGGTAACAALSSPLRDEAADLRDRAALAFYLKCPRGAVDCTKLASGMAMSDSPSAAAILLAGYCPAAREMLRRTRAGNTKLDNHSPVVPVRLVAAVALLRHGDMAVATAKSPRSQAEIEFLLEVLSDIQDPSWLLSSLDDRRSVLAATGAPRGVVPVRRVCDKAAEAFAERFSIPFETRPGKRYTPAEIASVRNGVRAKLAPIQN